MPDAVWFEGDSGLRIRKSDGQVAMLAEGLHVAGFEPAPLKLSPERSLAVKLPRLMVEDNQQSSAHQNWGDQPDWLPKPCKSGAPHEAFASRIAVAPAQTPSRGVMLL